MLRTFCFMFAVTLLYWSLVIPVIHGENVLLLNLFKDEEFNADLFKPEDIDSKLESDLISTYNFDEDSETVVLKNNTLNSTSEPEEIDITKSSNTVNLPFNNEDPVSFITMEKAETHPKHITKENSHLSIFSKVKDDTTVSKGFATELPERYVEGELYPFVRFCFDVIASFIQGVMKGIFSIGDTSTNTKITEDSTAYSQSTSRIIRKRDISLSQAQGFNENPESNTLKLTAKNGNQLKESLSNTTITLSVSIGQEKESDNSQDQTTLSTLKDSVKPIVTTLMDENKIKESNKEILNVNDSPISSSPSVLLKNSIKEQTGNSALVTKTFQEVDGEPEKNAIMEIQNEAHLHDKSSILTTPLQQKNIGGNSKKGNKNLDIFLDDSTEEENSITLLLNDIINKQNDLKLKEIIEKQFSTSQLNPQPFEGEYDPKVEETSTGTIIMMSIGAIFVVLVLVSIGLAAAYKLRLRWTLNMGRNRSGNQNPSNPRTTMA